jgi:hypothetical protein
MFDIYWASQRNNSSKLSILFLGGFMWHGQASQEALCHDAPFTVVGKFKKLKRL